MKGLQGLQAGCNEHREAGNVVVFVCVLQAVNEGVWEVEEVQGFSNDSRQGFHKWPIVKIDDIVQHMGNGSVVFLLLSSGEGHGERGVLCDLSHSGMRQLASKRSLVLVDPLTARNKCYLTNQGSARRVLCLFVVMC